MLVHVLLFRRRRHRGAPVRKFKALRASKGEVPRSVVCLFREVFDDVGVSIELRDPAERFSQQRREV